MDRAAAFQELGKITGTLAGLTAQLKEKREREAELYEILGIPNPHTPKVRRERRESLSAEVKAEINAAIITEMTRLHNKNLQWLSLQLIVNVCKINLDKNDDVQVSEDDIAAQVRALSKDEDSFVTHNGMRSRASAYCYRPDVAPSKLAEETTEPLKPVQLPPGQVFNPRD